MRRISKYFFSETYASIIPRRRYWFPSRTFICTSGADARQDFPSLAPIINHRSVISRDFCPSGRTKNFSQTKKKERDPTDTSILISKPRGIYARSKFAKANLTERYGGKFMYAVEMNAKIPARRSNVLELFADGCSNLKFSGSLNSLGASSASSWGLQWGVMSCAD